MAGLGGPVSAHRFEVEVDVDGEDVPGRSVAEYAQAALSTAMLRDAVQIDGFGDLPWTADVTAVSEL